MKNRFWLGIILLCVLLMTACGKATQEDVVNQAVKKWQKTNYDVVATMEVKTTATPRIYDINVWHTQPEYYRVQVKEQGTEVEQLIIRNDEGVFVVTPDLQKTYKFQNEWPKQNSQAYLIGALAEDLKLDKKAKMTEDENSYTFEVATRNSEKTGMPAQKVTIDKTSMMPKKVEILDELNEPKIVIAFSEIDVNKKHAKEEYAVEKFPENDDNKTTGNMPAEKFETYYPSVQMANTLLANEEVIDVAGMERVILTFEGEKAYTLMQQPVEKSTKAIPVFAQGDMVDLGFAIGAMTDRSISWEQDGKSFFLASTKLTQEEMLQVASTMTEGSKK